VDLHPLGILDLAAGIGQLGESIKRGLALLGYPARVLAHIERDSAAAAALRLRMDASELDRALIGDDLAEVDGRRLRGLISGLGAGLPCPGFSNAGLRIGNADPRAWGEDFNADRVETWGPIPHALRIVAESRPGFVFFENVPGWVRSGAYEPVWRELHGLGYTRQDAIFVAASDVRATHERERVFVLAVSEQWRRWFVESFGGAYRGIVDRRPSEELADRDGRRYGTESHAEQPPGRLDRCRTSLGHTQYEVESVAHTEASAGPTSHGRREGISTRDHRLPLYPPPRGTDLAAVTHALVEAAEIDRANSISPYDRGSASRRVTAAACRLARGIWRDWATAARLDPTQMPAIESKIPMVVDGYPYAAADLLRIGGNCVVADAATLAFVTIWRELVGGD
jgi:site-specific DNA-cytosine methylase